MAATPRTDAATRLKANVIAIEVMPDEVRIVRVLGRGLNVEAELEG